MLAYLAGRWKGHCIFCRTEPIPLLRASGSWHLGSFLWYLWPSVLSRIRSTVVPTSPNCTSTGPCHRLGTLLAVESLVVYKNKASVACLPYCAPVVCTVWKTGLLCQGLSPWLPLSLDVAHWTCSQSYPIIQLAPETYPDLGLLLGPASPVTSLCTWEALIGGLRWCPWVHPVKEPGASEPAAVAADPMASVFAFDSHKSVLLATC